jgi:hypothetical protein
MPIKKKRHIVLSPLLRTQDYVVKITKLRVTKPKNAIR